MCTGALCKWPGYATAYRRLKHVDQGSKPNRTVSWLWRVASNQTADSFGEGITEVDGQSMTQYPCRIAVGEVLGRGTELPISDGSRQAVLRDKLHSEIVFSRFV